ncbi:MAG: hypothetical protein AAFX50_23420, partial [Acidobacteriota bacterium]
PTRPRSSTPSVLPWSCPDHEPDDEATDIPAPAGGPAEVDRNPAPYRATDRSSGSLPRAP